MQSPRPPQLLSPTSTPASSVRPSLDIPQTQSQASLSGMVTPSGAPANARRNRAALRDYYNLKTGSGARSPSRRSSVTSTSTVTATPLTDSRASTDIDDHALSALDDPSFSPDEYVQKLLQTCSLSKVLRAENVLLSEIKTLDGDRKALVYDNYSKLIRATETIGGLMGRMDTQDKDVRTGAGGSSLLGVAKPTAPDLAGMQALGTLGPAVAHVADTAKSLAHDVNDEERNMSRIRRKRRQEVQTVRWVLQAPEALQRLLEDGETEKAEARWRGVRILLNKWDGVKGTQEIREQCEKIMSPDTT